MNKLKLYLVRRWLRLLPIQELRDETFRKTVDDWYGKMAASMIDMCFMQEFPDSKIKLFKEDRDK